MICSFIFLCFFVTVTGTALAYAEAHVVSLSIDNVVIGIDEAGDHIINNPGDVINYLITVNNNGDVDLHNVHVSDSLIDNLLGSAGVLKPGETLVYTVNYTVTHEDVNNNGKDGSGFIVNTATVSCDELEIQNSSTMSHIVQVFTLSTVVQVQGHPEVYLIKDGTKHHFTSPEALLWNGHNFSDVTNVTSETLQIYPDGQDISISQAIIDKYNVLGGAPIFGAPEGKGELNGDNDSAGTYCSYVNFKNGSIECFKNGDLVGNPYAIFNPFFSKWASMGYAKSVLGYPISDMSNVQTSKFGTQFRYHNFANGTESGALEYNLGSGNVFAVHGAIFAKWSSLGYANSNIGLVTSDEKVADASPQGTVGKYTEFENGCIHWISDRTGENIGHSQRGKSFVTYGALNKIYAEMGGTGSELGFPIEDQITNADEHDSCKFEGGSIGWDDSTGTYKAKLIITVGQGAPTPEITQKFIDAYKRNGGVLPGEIGPSALDNPTTKVHEAFGFQVQDIPGVSGEPGGVIMYNPNNNIAYFIHGAIWNKYYNYADKAKLGSVADDEKGAAVSPQKTTGRYTMFETGTIHWISDIGNDNPGHPKRGESFVTYGDLNAAYAVLGGTSSNLGFPINDQKADGKGHDYCEFEGGTISWDGSKYTVNRYANYKTIKGHVEYIELGNLLPLKYAKIELDVDNDPNNGILASSNTASDGNFNVEIDDQTDSDLLYMRIYADSKGSEKDKVSVSLVGGSIVYYPKTISKSSDSNNIVIPSEFTAFSIYEHMLTAYDFYANHLELRKVNVVLDNTLSTGKYDGNEIHINPISYSYHNNVHELYHEYSHFVMDSPHSVLKNMPLSIYDKGSGIFLVDDAPNSEYAWTEGWAIFSSAAINGNEKILVYDPDPFKLDYTIDLENANFLPFHAPQSSKNAIRNAAFLWDIYDGKAGWDLTETFDQFDGRNSIKDILDIIRGDKIYYTEYDNQMGEEYVNQMIYEHQTPLSAKEFYEGWVSSGKSQINEMNELVKHHFKDYINLKVHSPVNLHLYDSKGNHIGVNGTTGGIDREIMGSYYSGPDSHPQEIFVIRGDEDNQTSCVIEGKGEGTFTLEFENAENGKVVNTTYENVPVKKGSLGYLETNIEDGQHLLKMDFDGNGVIDKSITPTYIEINDSDNNLPSSITNLQSTNGTTWLNWTWTNPTDPDFNHTEIYLNGTFQTNTSAENFNATGLQPETVYTIGTRTVDNNGNLNETWINSTATTGKRATPTITWSNPADITYGTALSSTQLNAVASVLGNLVYIPGVGTVLSAGDQQNLHIEFTPIDSANYNPTSMDVKINILKATPTITWSNPADIIYGVALSDAQLNASASVPGTFVYTPLLGIVLSAGTQTLKVVFTPTDPTNYNTASQTATINVLTPVQKIQQIITMVQSLNLNKGQANSLIVKLNAATKNLNNGNIKAATNELNAFNNEVGANIKSGKLSSTQGQALIDATNSVIKVF